MVQCDSTSRGGQSYRRLAPWQIPNSRNQCPESSKTSLVPHDHDGGQPSHCQLLQPPLGGGVATFIVFSQRRLFVQGIIRFFSSNPRRLRQSAEPLNRRTLAAKARNFSLKMLISCSNTAASDKRWLLYKLDQSNWWSDSASDGTAQ